MPSCRAKRRHALVGPRFGLFPVEVVARRSGAGLHLPRTLAHADQRDPRRRHPSLLRAADGDVDPPCIGLDLDRADGADSVDDHDSTRVPAHARELAQRVGETGRGLVVREQEQLRLRVLLEHEGEIFGVDRLAPLELEPHDIGAVRRGKSREPLAEVAAQRDDHFVAGRYEVRDGRLETASAGGRQQQQVGGRLEDALGAGRDLGQDGAELRTAVIDHRPAHRTHDALGQWCRSGDPQLAREGHGRAPIPGFGRPTDFTVPSLACGSTN